MKTIIKNLSQWPVRLALGFWILVLGIFSACADGTPFYFRSLNADGTPNTGLVVMQAWPPSYTWTVYGTNVIYGGLLITNQPDNTGFFTNRVYPGGWRLYFPSLNSYVYANIPDTNAYNSLALYITSAPVTAIPNGYYAFITNILGGAPVVNNPSSVIAALGYMPLTNTFVAITNVLHYIPVTNQFWAITNALAYTPLTNSFVAITNALSYTPATNSFNGIVAAAGYTALTNSFTALTNAIGYTPATNSYAGIVAAAGYQPATNSFNSITNLLIASGGIPAILGYPPATNSSSGIFSALGYIPANITNTPGMFTGRDFAIITNGTPGVSTPLIIYTNMATAVVPILPAPNGSILVSSNGLDYIRTNSVWKGFLTQ